MTDNCYSIPDSPDCNEGAIFGGSRNDPSCGEVMISEVLGVRPLYFSNMQGAGRMRVIAT